MRSHLLLVLPAALVTLAACSSGSGPTVRPVAFNEYYDDATTGGVNSRALGDEGITASLFNKSGAASAADQGGALGVNAFLWRGALDTLSFMPLASADPFGGVIITDWYQPPAVTGERFKATAYILGRQLRSDGVRVTVFRQVLQNGQWVDATVSASTTGELENKVLARARELRAQTASN